MQTINFINTRYGRLANSSENDLIVKSLTLYGEWAQNELNILDRLIAPGDVVLDVGAYIGTHTLAFSRMVGPKGVVLAFEPQPVAAKALGAAIEENGLHNVALRQFAVGPATAVLHPDRVDPHNAGNFTLRMVDTVTADAVITISLDSLALSKCDLIKIDVEGLEADVLESAIDTIKRARPLIACACNFLDAGSRVFKFAMLNKYKVFSAVTPAFNLGNHAGCMSNIFGDAAEVMLILVPIEGNEKFNLLRADVELAPIQSTDDLALVLMKNPQHVSEVRKKFRNENVSSSIRNISFDTSPASYKKVVIFVSFYKSPELVGPLFESLSSCADEFRRVGARVVFCNDSPGHIGLAEALSECKSANTDLKIEFLENEGNLGFLRTVNRAFADAVARGEDILLLNSDTVFFPGVLTELIAVAYSDPMIGFVSPRSNNATLCTFPHGADLESTAPSQAFHAFSAAAYRLPRVSYVPTAVGFCLLVKCNILAEFGYFDEIYGAGYCEEVDLVMRANRYGYRAALANWAFVWHAGEASFARTSASRMIRDKQNFAHLNDRYPEYIKLIENYFASPEYNAERLICAVGQASPSLRIGFDFSNFGAWHNGTFEAGARLLDAAAASWPSHIEIFVFISEAAWSFHGLGRFPRVQRRDLSSDEVVAAIVRMGQPFSAQCVTNLMRRAPVVSTFMLDTIAFDCGYLRIKFNENIWHFVLNWFDVIFTNSEFTAQQFRRRFKLGRNAILMASPHSFTPSDYVHDRRSDKGLARSYFDGGPYVLVIGNAFEHKALETTVAALAAHVPALRVVALGMDQTNLANVRCVPTGQLDESEVHALFDDASCLIYPSHYEGFGFPLMHALARKKPILVRPLPPFKEAVAAMRDGGGNVIWFDTTSELCSLLQAGVPDWKGAEAIGEESGWRRSADEVLDALTRRLVLVRYENIVDRLRWLGAVADESSSVRMGRVQAARQFLSYYPYAYKAAARIWPLVRKIRRQALSWWVRPQ